MCDHWPCCHNTFNVARIDTETGRFLWQRLFRSAKAATYYGWNATGLTALPGTDDAAVMLYAHKPDNSVESWMQVTRITSNGSAVWESNARHLPADGSLIKATGMTSTLSANGNHIFAGTAPNERGFFETDPDVLMQFDHAGNRLALPLLVQAGQQQMAIVAIPNGGCYYNYGYPRSGQMFVRRFDGGNGTLWSSVRGVPFCLDDEQNVLSGDQDIHTGQLSLLRKADGVPIAESVDEIIAPQCAVLWNDRFWVGCLGGIKRFNATDLAYVDSVVELDLLSPSAIVAVPEQDCVIATCQNLSNVSITCFESDGTLRWEVPWGRKTDKEPTATSYPYASIARVWRICVTENGAVLVCGEQAFR